MRDERREKEKYARASLREQLGDELSNLARHPPLVILLVFLVGGWLFLTITQPTYVRVGEVQTGACLYIRAADASTDLPTSRAIGSDAAAVSALFEQGAELAPCDGSHSHEVAEAWILDDPLVAPYPGQAELTTRERPRCDAAFAGHVGRPAEGSTFALTIAVPAPGPWAEGARAGLCLVSRRDGAFMGTHAKGSAQ